MQQRKNKALLESSLERVARVLVDRYDIKVVYHGDLCCTEGRTIVLPSIPEDCPDDLFEAIQGYLDHEAAHLIFDDFEITNRIREPFTALWLNVMNDLRDERQLGELWRGCKRNLSKASLYALENKILGEWDESSDVSKFVRSSIFYGAGEHYFFDRIPNGDKWLEKIDPIKVALELAPKQLDIMHSLAVACWVIKQLGREPCLDGLSGIQKEILKSASSEFEEELERAMSSEEESALSVGIPGIEKVFEEAKEGEGEEGEGEEGEGEEGEGEGASEEEEGASEGEEGEGEEGEGEGGEGEGGEGEGGEGEGGEGEGASKEEEEEKKRRAKAKLQEEFGVDDREIEKAKREIEEDKGAAIKDGVASYRHYKIKDPHKFYLPFSTEKDLVKIAPPGDKAKFLRDRQDIRKGSGVMIRRLHACLTTRERSITQYDKTSGGLNARAFPRFLNTGYDRVFKRTSVGESLNCRISLLIDQSGSMGVNNKEEEARRAAVLFGEFCSQKKIPFEILSFTTTSFYTPLERYSKASAADKEKYTRWGNLKITIYKEFHEAWLKVGHRLSNFSAENHNYDGEAVKFATRRLLLAKKGNERLILFVFSDGLPEQAIDQCAPNHQWYLGKMVEESISRGVECVGIGICTDSVKRYYPNWIIINDPTSLAAAQLDKLKEVLSFMRKTVFRKKSFK